MKSMLALLPVLAVILSCGSRSGLASRLIPSRPARRIRTLPLPAEIEEE